MAIDENKLKAVRMALTSLQKEFGGTAVNFVGESNIDLTVSGLSTGSPSLDYAIGVGGLPRGRIIELFGPEQGGKSLLLKKIIAAAQQQGEICAYIDAEQSLDKPFAETLGVDVSSLIVSQESCFETAIGVVEELVRSNGVGVIGVDSVAALVPKTELEGSLEDQSMGLQARLMARAMARLTESVHKSQTILIFINQLRDKIGAMWGPTEDTPGGRALKFYASVRMDVRKVSGDDVKMGDVKCGHKIRVKIVKNKVGPPFNEAELRVVYRQCQYNVGIDPVFDLIEYGLKSGRITKSGNTYLVGEQKMGLGRDNVETMLRDPATFETWKKVICG